MQNSSNSNTVLITLLIIIVVGFGVYWVSTREAATPEPTGGPELQVNI